MLDSKIWGTLEPLFPSQVEDLPLDGEWLQPPFANDGHGRAIILNEDDFQQVVVDRKSGAVRFVCEDDETLIASNLESFAQLVKAWSAIDRDTPGPEDDQQFFQVWSDFQKQLKVIDAAAAAPNEFWQLYAEELTSNDYSDPDEQPSNGLAFDDDLVDAEPDSGDNDRPRFVG